MSTEEAFIRRVRSCELLYDKKNLNYTNISEKEKIWKELSLEFGWDAKKKWTRLRDKYVKEKKKLLIAKHDSNDSQTVSNWELFNEMRFVNEHIKPRSVLPNLKKDDEEEEEETEGFEEIYEPAEEDVRAFYNEFCMEILPETNSNSNNHSPSQRISKNFNGSICSPNSRNSIDSMVSRNSIEHSIGSRLSNSINDYDDVEYEIKKPKLQLTDETEVVETEKEELEIDDEDAIFTQLIRLKMNKMTPADKSNFQLDVFKKADQIILKDYD